MAFQVYRYLGMYQKILIAFLLVINKSAVAVNKQFKIVYGLVIYQWQFVVHFINVETISHKNLKILKCSRNVSAGLSVEDPALY